MKDLLELVIGMKKDIKELPDSIRELIEGYKQHIKELKSQHQKEIEKVLNEQGEDIERVCEENQKLKKELNKWKKVIGDTSYVLGLEKELSDLKKRDKMIPTISPKEFNKKLKEKK